MSTGHVSFVTTIASALIELRTTQFDQSLRYSQMDEDIFSVNAGFFFSFQLQMSGCQVVRSSNEV